MRSDCSFVRTARGLRLAYVEQGEREGPAVVMLHGYTDSHRSFDLLRPHLPEAWRAIAVTAREGRGSPAELLQWLGGAVEVLFGREPAQRHGREHPHRAVALCPGALEADAVHGLRFSSAES